MRAMALGAAAILSVAGFSFESKGDPSQNNVQVAQVRPCFVTTVYQRSNGRVSYQTCIRGGEPTCNAVPPEGICSGYWGVGIVNKICQVVAHC